jgi:hypothetical protein
MEFQEKKYKNFTYWHLPHLTDRGVFHGFGGSSLDIRKDEKAWAQTYPRGPKLRLLKQVHGTSIARAGEVGAEYEADAWVQTKEFPDSVFGIRTADCVPVLLFAPGVTAAIHCGWRGVLGNLLGKTIYELGKLGVKSPDIQLAIGPHARGCCYEIGVDLEEKIADQTLVSRGSVIRDDAESGKMYCELGVVLRAQAEELGVLADNYYEHEACTICSDKFFSYRRQKDLAGRQLSFVSLGSQGTDV